VARRKDDVVTSSLTVCVSINITPILDGGASTSQLGFERGSRDFSAMAIKSTFDRQNSFSRAIREKVHFLNLSAGWRYLLTIGIKLNTGTLIARSMYNLFVHGNSRI
jgi:hypothetical protein